jgi:KDO2-lipid IV(A) lauroyltransferase
MRNLHRVLGDELGPDEAERLAQEFFRMVSCEVIDMMRLRGRARSLGKLVEIRGREHLEAVLAGGKGAILCSAHFGSYTSAFSLLHASGFPLTTIGRWHWNYTPGLCAAERRFWDLVCARRVRRHRERPYIEPWPGRVQVAAEAAAALRANEVVTISSDAPPLDADRTRTVEVAFLGRQATLLPGVVTLARLTEAPVLMAFVYRSADYRHQVLEISPPVPMQGDTATALGGCVTAMDAAIRTSPAHWVYWNSTDDLASLGLLRAAPLAGTATVSPVPAVGGPSALLEEPQGTVEVTKLEVLINDYISRKLVQDATLLPLTNATPLLESGVLDSLSLLTLVLFVHERFGIEVNNIDLISEHFASVDAICAYLRSRAGGRMDQAGGYG